GDVRGFATRPDRGLQGGARPRAAPGNRASDARARHRRRLRATGSHGLTKPSAAAWTMIEAMDRDSGRRVVLAVWVLVAVDVALAFVTYARLPAAELYHVSGTGLEGGLSRALVEANFPAALMAVAVLLTVAPRPRWLAWVAGLLCLVVVVPG